MPHSSTCLSRKIASSRQSQRSSAKPSYGSRVDSYPFLISSLEVHPVTTQYYKQYGETVHRLTLQGRLPVTFIEKPGYHKVYVTLTAPLGAVHRHYLDASAARKEVPAGIAHFLEHKIFEQVGEDISRHFALHEAQVNAYTEHHRTTYLFSATNHVLDNTVRLLEMFFYPRFTPEGVEKEKNIIIEELNMHLDNPHYQQYYQLLKHMFHDHPVTVDILGTKESIQAISYEALSNVHRAYYQPEKCHLTLVGDPQHLKVLEALEAHVTLPTGQGTDVQDFSHAEATCVASSGNVLEADVLMPSVMFGIKRMQEGRLEKEEKLRHQIATTLFFDLVFGQSGPYYEAWLDAGLINDAYDYEVSFEPSYGMVFIYAETDKPKAFVQTLHETMSTLATTAPIEEDDFKRVKRQMLGNFVRSLDALEHLAHESARLALQGVSVYDLLEVAQTVSLAAVRDVAKTLAADTLSSVTMLPIPTNKAPDSE
ncbi:MAG: insulinase family protein [Acholeplasmatales bacterium]|nr:MAG: insulinase family protein [Acholeplasmatales bacterium]